MSDAEPKLIVSLSSAEPERLVPRNRRAASGAAVAKPDELEDAFCGVEAELGPGGVVVGWGGGDMRYLTKHMLGGDVLIVDAMYGVRCMLGMTGIGTFPTTRARPRRRHRCLLDQH